MKPTEIKRARTTRTGLAQARNYRMQFPGEDIDLLDTDEDKVMYYDSVPAPKQELDVLDTDEDRVMQYYTHKAVPRRQAPPVSSRHYSIKKTWGRK